ncbi:nucleotidyltransferase [Candidatus Megaera polyxenophila]|nr:nucleotidyltransferase [Candidatus Megaera polyxenophila]
MLLYDSGEFKLSEAKELPTEKRKEIAQKDYKHWFGKGASFFIDTFHALERKDFNKGAFGASSSYREFLQHYSASFYRL